MLTRVISGDDRFLEAMEYVGLHQLYETALSIWRDTGKYPVDIQGPRFDYHGSLILLRRLCWMSMGIGSSNDGTFPKPPTVS